MNRYSDKLIEKYKKYMYEKHNLKLSNGEAESDLESLATVYTIFHDTESKKEN